MSKYISAEYIKILMKNDRLMQGNAEYTLWEQKVERIVDTMPTIDIVHCGECKYFNEDKCWNLKGLNKTDGVVKADDFCSNGERKDNE